MTADNTIVAAEPAPASYVRATTNFAFDMYGQVKNSNCYLKSAVEKVESRVPVSWVETISTTCDPVVDAADTKICQVTESATALYATATDKIAASVIVPAKEVGEQIKSTVSARVIDPVTAKVVVPVREAASKTKNLASKTKDLYATGEWKSIRGDLSKKAAQRLETGLVAAKEFSATRGKEMIHFDLIEYSREVLDNANAAAKPMLEPVQQRVANAVVKVNAAVSSLQESIVAKSAETNKQYETVRANLTERLHFAMAAARELSGASVEYVQNTYKVVKTGSGEYAALLPKAIDDATKFILASPALFLEVTSKADISTSKRAIDNVRNLLEAVRTVFLPAIQQARGEEAEVVA